MKLKLATTSSKVVMLDKSLNNNLTFLSRDVGPDPPSSLPRNKIDTAIYIYIYIYKYIYIYILRE